MGSSFSKIERKLSIFLFRYPKLKKVIKHIYLRVTYLYHVKKETKVTSKKIVDPFDEEMKEYESFFGYYDKTPMSINGMILCHFTKNKTKKLPEPGSDIIIGVFDRFCSTPLLTIKSNAFNWQQGSRAHWISPSLFIFNDFDVEESKYISRVFSTESLSEVKCFSHPVQDSFGTEYFLSINYRRVLSLRPDYGYRNLPKLSRQELLNLEDDGIVKVCYTDGTSMLLFSLKDIVHVSYKNLFQSSLHKVNHLMISPLGDKFIFIHRCYNSGKRYDRLMLACSNGKFLKIIADYDMVSHCFWIDNEKILGYLRGPNGHDGYWKIDLCSGEWSEITTLNSVNCGDGHPHVLGPSFVTDTYPDKARMQKLLIFDFISEDFEVIGSFKHGFSFYGETRCDLHPRFSHDGKIVFIDSVFNGKRRLYKIDL